MHEIHTHFHVNWPRKHDQEYWFGKITPGEENFDFLCKTPSQNSLKQSWLCILELQNESQNFRIKAIILSHSTSSFEVDGKQAGWNFYLCFFKIHSNFFFYFLLWPFLNICKGNKYNKPHLWLPVTPISRESFNLLTFHMRNSNPKK